MLEGSVFFVVVVVVVEVVENFFLYVKDIVLLCNAMEITKVQSVCPVQFLGQ